MIVIRDIYWIAEKDSFKEVRYNTSGRDIGAAMLMSLEYTNMVSGN